MFKVFAKMKDGRTVDTGETFKTKLEAETYAGIEGM